MKRHTVPETGLRKPAGAALGLRGKVMLLVAAGIALVFAVMAVVVFKTEQRLVERQLVRGYRQSAKAFAAIISHAIRDRDFRRLQEVVEHKAKEENIRYLLLRDAAGKIVIHSGDWSAWRQPAHAGEAPGERLATDGSRNSEEPPDLLRAEGHVFEVDEPVPGLAGPGEWTVHMGVDTEEANREVVANTWRIVVLSGIVLAVSLAAMFLIDHRLRRIFRELTTVTCRMAKGDRSLRVNIRTGDELQILGESFNAMANALREKEEQIQSHAEDLEGRVRERTQALLAEKQKLGAILGAIRAGLILYDRGSKPVWMNDIAQGWLNGSDELPSPVHRELFRGRDGVEEVARQVLWKKAPLETEKQVEDPGGEVQHFQISAAPISADGDGAIQALVVLLDVSEKKRLERRLQHASKMVAIGELAGGVAHEINTPVGVVIAKAEFLLERLRGRAAPKDIGDLQKVLRNAQRIAAITRGLLSFSRKSGARRRDVEVNSLLREAVALLAERIRAAEAQVETSLAPSIPAICANPEELQQVFVNLLGNALDAMSSRDHRPRRLEVSTAQIGKSVNIRIADTGCGIPAALRERIFEPFYSTKGVGKGTGLGLAISLGIVKAHGGRIGVESKLNEYSVFTVELPIGVEVSVCDGAKV